MGASGTGIFDDDSAMDFLAELREERDPTARMRAVFDAAPGAAYLEYDDAQEVLVGAAVVDAVRHGTPLDAATDDEDLPEWTASLDKARVSSLADAATRAVRRVLAAESELRELWEENEEDYPAWKASVEALAQRLASKRP
jgi:hypothetical protein